MKLVKGIAKIGYRFAEDNVNAVCPWFFYVPKIPDKVQGLKKR